MRQAIAAGADGFKDDDAEGAFLSSNQQGDVKFHDGADPRLMRNRYGTLYNNAMEELIQKDLKGNGVLFARSVTTGANGIFPRQEAERKTDDARGMPKQPLDG